MVASFSPVSWFSQCVCPPHQFAYALLFISEVIPEVGFSSSSLVFLSAPSSQSPRLFTLLTLSKLVQVASALETNVRLLVLQIREWSMNPTAFLLIASRTLPLRYKGKCSQPTDNASGNRLSTIYQVYTLLSLCLLGDNFRDSLDVNKPKIDSFSLEL